MTFKNSIVIISCWYGAYPWYHPYYLHSCSFNVSIDFYIITDNDVIIPNLPINVKIIRKHLKDFIEIASKKLGFYININHPYKLNDFKPAYAFLFPELIEGYDFWGHSDLDIIHGNIRDFLTNEMLCKYDFISLRHGYTTGCFCLYRNNEILNTYFKRSKDYQMILTNPRHYCLMNAAFCGTN